MIKVSVVGDCHTARVYSHHIISNISKNFIKPRTWKKDREIEKTGVELYMWGLAGYKCWGVDYQKDYNDKTLSSSSEDVPDLSPITDNLVDIFSFSETKDSDIVMPWLGYIDIRNFLCKYKNSQDVAEKYFNETLKFFSESQVRFIEPFPQFDILGTDNYDENYSLAERKEESDIFIKILHDLSMDNGLLPPIQQSLVYNAIGSDTITKRFAKQGGEYHNYTLLDGLRSEENKKIYNALVPEILSTVRLLS
jgi:hypothetical protein